MNKLSIITTLNTALIFCTAHNMEQNDQIQDQAKQKEEKKNHVITREFFHPNKEKDLNVEKYTTEWSDDETCFCICHRGHKKHWVTNLMFEGEVVVQDVNVIDIFSGQKKPIRLIKEIGYPYELKGNNWYVPGDPEHRPQFRPKLSPGGTYLLLVFEGNRRQKFGALYPSWISNYLEEKVRDSNKVHETELYHTGNGKKCFATDLNEIEGAGDTLFVDFTPDETHVVLATETNKKQKSGSYITIKRSCDGKDITSLHYNAPFKKIIGGPKNNHLLILYNNNQLIEWNFITDEKRELPDIRDVSTISAREQYVTLDTKGIIHLRDGRSNDKLTQTNARALKLTCSPRGTHIAWTNYHQWPPPVWIWNREKQCIHEIRTTRLNGANSQKALGYPSAIAFTPDEKCLVLQDKPNTGETCLDLEGKDTTTGNAIVVNIEKKALVNVYSDADDVSSHGSFYTVDLDKDKCGLASLIRKYNKEG